MPSEKRVTGGCTHYIPDAKCAECDERNRCDDAEPRRCPKCGGEMAHKPVVIPDLNGDWVEVMGYECPKCGTKRSEYGRAHWCGHEEKVK